LKEEERNPKERRLSERWKLEEQASSSFFSESGVVSVRESGDREREW